tara:strand:- start:507 stop:953 length:447 start_codon:yes stop_codon:yes gene_type:complete
MTEAEASEVYSEAIAKMRDLYDTARWQPGRYTGRCSEDVMEEQVPEKHWIVVRRVLIDSIRHGAKESTCNFCRVQFSSHNKMLAHRGHAHPEQLERWRQRGVPQDYRAGVQVQYILKKYGLRRSVFYKILDDHNITIRGGADDWPDKG